MPSTNSVTPLFDRIDNWLTEVDAVKTAAAKKAPAKKAGVKKAAPDGMGETSHPSEDVDDNTHGEQTGSRFEENSADVKKDVPGQSVDETDPGSGGSQDDKQYNIGTNQSATGEDASVEDDFKGDKDDPGTSHPMNADDVGEKYSSLKLEKLLKLAEDKAHAILADLANGVGADTPRTSVKQKVAAVKTVVAQTAPSVKPESYGYDVATATEQEKSAAEFVAQTIRDADLDADLVGSFLHTYSQTKRAEGEEEAPPEDGGSTPEDAAAALPPEGGMPGGGEGGDVLAALGAGGGGMPPEAGMGGELPPEAGMGGEMGGGMPPEAAMGGEGGEGNGPPGGMNEEQALQELVMALAELGISPEQLAQMAQGAGAPPGAAEEGQKLASHAKKFRLSGKFRIEEAKTASQREARNQIKDYLLEITGLKR